jgi:hypothetical protein
MKFTVVWLPSASKKWLNCEMPVPTAARLRKPQIAWIGSCTPILFIKAKHVTTMFVF